MQLVIDIEACYGCRTCELACSFHRRRVFSPDLSGIRVSRNSRTGKIEYSLDSSCDLCKEERPLCVEYCFYGALKAVRKKNEKDKKDTLSR